MAGPISEVGLPRAAAFAAIIVVALAIQSTILPQVTLLGVIPQLVLLVVVVLAYIDGERVGTVIGFSAGLLQDFLLPGSILGLTALIYTLLGYGVGYLRQYAPSDSVWTPVLTVALTTAVAETGYATMSVLMGQKWATLQFTGRSIGLVVLYNTLLTPFVFPLVKRVADRLRPERVFR